MGCGSTSLRRYAASSDKGQHATDELIGHRLRGVSVAYFAERLLKEASNSGFQRSATVYDVEPKVINEKGKKKLCPRDGLLGAAYVDCVETSSGAAGLSSYMLSYSWGYSIGDIADSLQEFCTETSTDSRNAFIWMCCLCINQHRVRDTNSKQEDVPFEVFQSEFGWRVRNIGHIIAMMAPWRDPGYVHRVWCNFEMFTALDLGEDRCQVSVIMPPREKSSLEAALLEGSGLNDVWQSFADVRVENASASVEKDRLRILSLIRDPPGPGFHKLNSTIAKRLQAWVVRTASSCLEARLDAGKIESELASKLCSEVGKLLVRVGLLERASVLLERGESVCQRSGSLNTPNGARLLRELGILRREQGDFEKAHETLVRAKDILSSDGCLESTEGASVLSSIGFVEFERGHVGAALGMYLQARSIRDKTETLVTADGAMLLRNIGAARQLQGDLNSALEAYQEAKETLEHLCTLATPQGALLLTDIATVHRERGDLNRALSLYEDAQRIREQTGTLETPYGAELLRLLGIVHREQGDVTTALIFFEHAMRVRTNTATLETPPGASLISSLGYAKFTLGDATAALALFAQARAIRERTGTFCSPDGALLCRNVGMVRSSQGDHEGALEAYSEAMQKLKAEDALKTPLGAWLLTGMGVAKQACGDAEAALALYLEAKQIREESCTMATAYGQKLTEMITNLQSEQSTMGSKITMGKFYSERFDA